MKFKLPRYFLLVVLLLVCFLVRVQRADYPIMENGGEGSRDYLVASHITKYHEYIQIGPYNGGTNNLLKNSPVYYYLISLPLYINNDISTLIFANILLQLLSIALIYLLAQKMFGIKTALAAALIFAFMPEILRDSNSIWPPYVMQPFVIGSYFCLYRAYTKSSLKYLLLGLTTLTFAIAIHNSALAQLPIYAALSLIVAREIKTNRSKYILILLSVVLPIIILYWPVLLYYAKPDPLARFINHQPFLVNSPEEFAQLLTNSLQNLTRLLHFTNTVKTFSLDSIFLAVFFLAVTLYKNSRDSKAQKKFMLVLFCAVMTQILFASILPAARWSFYQTPTLALFCILIAGIIFCSYKKNYLFLGLKMFIIVFIAGTLVVELVESKKTDLKNTQIINQATQSVKKELLEVQSQEKFPELNFFRVMSSIPHPNTISDAVLWVPLEKEFNQKFTKTSNQNSRSFEDLNTDRYVFLACYYYKSFPNGNRECLDRFLTSHIFYSHFSTIYSDDLLTIYLTKRIN